jgi:hypothetical protein
MSRRVRTGREVTLPLGSLFMYNEFMPRSIAVKRKKRGRPATGADPLVAARMPPELIRSIDAWAAAHADGSRSEAIRRLVERGLGYSKYSSAETTSLGPMPPEIGSTPAAIGRTEQRARRSKVKEKGGKAGGSAS